MLSGLLHYSISGDKLNKNKSGMSYKKNLEQLESYFEKKNRRSTMIYRRSVKKGRNKWVRRSTLPNANKIRKGWEY